VLCLSDDWRIGDADFTCEATDREQTEGEEETDAQDAVHAGVSETSTCLFVQLCVLQ